MTAAKKTAKKPQKKKASQSGLIFASGKRKRAVARAILSPGSGIVRINSHLLECYTPEMARMRIMEPLSLAGDVTSKLNIDIDVRGGGWQGQTEASRLALAKALAAYDKKLRKIFNDYDKHLLVADVRFKESRKPNDSKARASRQFSKR